ncbi:MAG: dihydrolipoyllysine-residue acetyltransferase [Betaproteobacteria bacterium]|nr:dihydrolipoyllysine-residue acetyltransferase [Betaproteobacteria bacterium]
MANVIEVTVPDIGDFKNIPVIEVFVKPGDTVKAEDSLLTLESDKATMDVPSPAAGVVKQILIKTGDKVSKGTPVLVLEAVAGATAAPAAEKTAPAPAKPATPTPAPAPAPARATAAPAPQAPAPMPIDGTAHRLAHASPSVRLFARELGVDLSRVKGSGPKERILREDVQAFVKQALVQPQAPAGGAGGGLGFNLPPLPQVDFAKFGAIEVKALSRIRKLSGGFLHRNWLNVPHVTQHDEADITELEAFRKAQADTAKAKGVKLTPLVFTMKAAVVALKQFPEFNSSLSGDGESLTLKRYYHIGVAVDTPNGLVVPVIRDVDKKGLLELAGELGEVGERMRAGKITPNDVQGGSFSISSLGGIGGTLFTPIINAPEVAILGVGKSVMKPVWHPGEGGAFKPRLMLPLSLSYDHRVIDGAQGARFVSFLTQTLADIRRLAL